MSLLVYRLIIDEDVSNGGVCVRRCAVEVGYVGDDARCVLVVELLQLLPQEYVDQEGLFCVLHQLEKAAKAVPTDDLHIGASNSFKTICNGGYLIFCKFADSTTIQPWAFDDFDGVVSTTIVLFGVLLFILKAKRKHENLIKRSTPDLHGRQ